MSRSHLPTAAAVIVLAAGCIGGAGDDGRVSVYETTGKVTLSGKPVADAVVTFSPKGQHPVAVAPHRRGRRTTA